jgi:putative ABC transport system substrate-binding protein
MSASLIGRARVAVIAATGSPAAGLAAKTATTSIPIVFSSGSNPVKLGLVSSLSRPDGNLTGVNLYSAELITKQLDLLHELLPQAGNVAVLVNPAAPYVVLEAEDARGGAHTGNNLRSCRPLHRATSMPALARLPKKESMPC